MPPRTRSSQTGGSNVHVHAHSAQNENQVVFQDMGAPNQGKMASVNCNVQISGVMDA